MRKRLTAATLAALMALSMTHAVVVKQQRQPQLRRPR